MKQHNAKCQLIVLVGIFLAVALYFFVFAFPGKTAENENVCLYRNVNLLVLINIFLARPDGDDKSGLE